MAKDYLTQFLPDLKEFSCYEQWIALHHEKFAQLLDQYTSS